MMKRVFSLFFLVAGAVMMCGCRTGYFARTQDVAILERKGDWQVAGGCSLMDGVNVSAAYAAGDKVAVQVSGAMWPERGECPVVRAAVGGYHFFENKVFVAFYGGAEYQKVNFSYGNEDWGAKHYGWSHYPSCFGTADLGWRPTGWFECGLRLTLGGVAYFDRDWVTRMERAGEGEPYVWGAPQEERRRGVAPLAQTSVVVRLGCVKGLKFDLKAGVDWGLCISERVLRLGNPTYEFPAYAGVGLSYFFSKKVR